MYTSVLLTSAPRYRPSISDFSYLTVHKPAADLEETRTWDLSISGPELYRLSYRAPLTLPLDLGELVLYHRLVLKSR